MTRMQTTRFPRKKEIKGKILMLVHRQISRAYMVTNFPSS